MERKPLEGLEFTGPKGIEKGSMLEGLEKAAPTREDMLLPPAMTREYDKLSNLEGGVKNLEREASESAENLKKLRESLGLPQTSELTSSESALQALQEKLKDQREKVGRLDKEFLGLSERSEGEVGEGGEVGGSAELDAERLKENNPDEQEKVQKLEKEEEDIEKELIEARRKAIENFIEANTKDALAKANQLLTESQNGEKAARLLEFKIGHTVRNSPDVKKYIAEGGEIDLQISWQLKFEQAVNTEGRVEEQRITGVDVKLKSALYEKAKGKEEQLTFSQDQEQAFVRNTEEEGGALKVQEGKTAQEGQGSVGLTMEKETR